MIKLELKDEWDGWSGIAIPDDMNVEIRTEAITSKLNISLIELLELYGFVIHEESCEFLVGTGTMVGIVKQDDQIRFKTGGISVQITFEELRESLDHLLREVFATKDEREGPDERGDSIQYAEKKLQENDIEYDVKTLYQRLIEE